MALMAPAVLNLLDERKGADAKPIFFYGILVGQCVVFALSGALYNRRINQENRFLQWYDGLVLRLVLWLFAGLILLPLSGAGIFGASLSAGYLAGLLSLGIVGLVFGLLFVLLQRLIARQIAARDVTGEKAIALDADEESYGALSPRALLKNVAVAAAVVLAGVGPIKFISSAFRNTKVNVGQLIASL